MRHASTSDGEKKDKGVVLVPASPRKIEQSPKAKEVPSPVASPRSASNPALLRKRTMSQGDVPRMSIASDGALKTGQSILEQIGIPDHNGWMRKKGERYNSWKMRYFVLKGPHLYCLRNNSPSVSLALWQPDDNVVTE
jgi:hypothetical protein